MIARNPSYRWPRLLFGVLGTVAFLGFDWAIQFPVDLAIGHDPQDALGSFAFLMAFAVLAGVPLGLLLLTRWLRDALRGTVVPGSTPRWLGILMTYEGLLLLSSLRQLTGSFYDFRSALYAIVMLVPLVALAGAAWALLAAGARVGKDVARIAFVSAPLTVAWFLPAAGLFGLLIMVLGLRSLTRVRPPGAMPAPPPEAAPAGAPAPLPEPPAAAL